jgi:acyl-CoA synthetase (AMP-forming)/AMP-acid ligase II
MPVRAWPGRWRGSGVGSVDVEGTTFFSVLGQLAEADPGRPALTCGEVTLTRAEFVERVERLAGLFADRGVAEGSTVTIVLPNSIGLVESLFAAWALGAVPQPISDRLPPLERAAIVDLASPSLVVGVPPSEAAGRPALESVPRQLPLRDFDGRPVPAGQEGEIWMRRGPGAPSPYQYIGATARSAPGGWESLGDIGHVDACGPAASSACPMRTWATFPTRSSSYPNRCPMRT